MCSTSSGAMTEGTGPGEDPSSVAASEPVSGVPSKVMTSVLSRLPPDEVALSARRTCRAAAQHFAEEHHRTASVFSGATPPQATAEIEAAFRGLSFSRKRRTLSVAAASGSIANLEVAWQLLQPCLLPEVLQTGFYLVQVRQDRFVVGDAGTASVKGGCVGALSWLLGRCPGLVNCFRTVEAAAKHCPLPQLQEAWGMLSATDSSLRLDSDVLAAAAESPTADAIAKMQWLLQQGSCLITHRTAAAAARSGDMARLRWLQDRGCPFDNWGALEAALQHADLSVAEWLVDEAGCPLPGPANVLAVVSAAAADGSGAKLRWLQARGVLGEGPSATLLMAVAGTGQLDTLRCVHQPGRDAILDSTAIAHTVRSGSVESVAYLMGPGCSVGINAMFWWYGSGCKGGLAMLRWLVEEARVPASILSLRSMVATWPDATAADSLQLLEAVRLVAPLLGPSGCGRATEDAVAALCLAAGRGDLGLLRYLHEELECKLGSSVLAGAAGGGSEAVLEWLVEQGCGAGATGTEDDCYLAAGCRGDRATLSCLRRLGVPWSEGVLLKAVQQGLQLPVLQWMWEQGARAGLGHLQEAAVLAEAQGDSDRGRRVAEWLRRVGGAWKRGLAAGPAQQTLYRASSVCM